MGNDLFPPAGGFGHPISIDDGTSARIESPVPGPVGLDAKGGGASKQATPSLAERILGAARRRRGDRVGDGECFTFVNRMLTGAGARSAADFGPVVPTADYTWGTSIGLSDLQPGDVIQLRDYRFDREITTSTDDGESVTEDFEERPHHTVIVERVDGNGAVTVLEQNAPVGSPVIRSQLFFSDHTTESGNTTTTISVRGTFWFYRAEAR